MRSNLHKIKTSDADVFFDPDSLELFLQASTAARIKARYGDAVGMSEETQRKGVFAEPKNKLALHGDTLKFDKLVLLTTQECNLRCRYCFAQDSYLSSSESPSTSKMVQAVSEAAISTFMRIAEGKITTILFFGGEPLLNSSMIYHCVAFVKKLAKSFSTPTPQFALVTNGTLIDRQFASFLAENDFAVTLSLDGPPDVHDAQRVFEDGCGSYAAVHSALKVLRPLVSNLVCQTTYTQEHIKRGYSPLQTAQYIKSIGVNRLHMLPAIGQSSVLTIPNDSWPQVFTGFKDLCEASVTSLSTSAPLILDQAMNILNSILLKHKRRFICTAGIDTYTVDAVGDVYPCYMMNTDEYRMGKVLDGEFPGDSFHSVRTHFQSLDRSGIKKCSGCFARNICYSCYGDGFLRDGTPTSPSHIFCSFLRGLADGTISGLARIRMDNKAWSGFLANCSSGAFTDCSESQRAWKTKMEDKIETDTEPVA